MTGDTTVSISAASSLARALGNALAFMPARNRISHVGIFVGREVKVAGCKDGYVAGVDVVATQGEIHGDSEAAVFLTPETADLLKAYLVAHKKHSISVVADEVGALVIDSPIDGQITFECAQGDAASTDRDRGLYEGVFKLIAAGELRRNTIPGVLMIDPGLMTPFAKIKADSGDRKADLLIGDPAAPILVKIGPTFKGLIMPVDRERNAEHTGEDGLWS